MLLILEAIFESNFSTHSHDLKSNIGCHSVLGEIKCTLTEIKWFYCYLKYNLKIILIEL
jgi:hypothetical protein